LRPTPPQPESVDIVLFSPPYPNNIDYTEVYKLEAWLLGFIESTEEFRAERLKTVYSHPSLLRGHDATRAAAAQAQLDGLLEPILSAIPSDRYSRGRRRMVAGYVRDMHLTLESAFMALRPGGALVYVVGNSLHGSGGSQFVIAADLLLAQLASNNGFRVTRFEVARTSGRRGRDKDFLRESVVFARKPEQ
jgi:hypothetical protein